MPGSDLKPGLSASLSATVTRADLASSYGNPGVDVLSSMTLMTLLEGAAIAVLTPHLDPAR